MPATLASRQLCCGARPVVRESGAADARALRMCVAGSRVDKEKPMTPGIAKKFEHVIITRFNLSYSEDPRAIHLNERWLSERFTLFEQFCLPSVRWQSNQNFAWVVLLDRGTPELFRDQALTLAESSTRTKVIFCGPPSRELYQRAVTSVISPDCEWVITTSLDSDDAIHPRFVDALQSGFQFDVAEALNFPHGIVQAGARSYLRRDGSNAFISLSEPAVKFSTVLSFAHAGLGRYARLAQLTETPMWLQVVHGSNVSNRIRGVRIASKQVPEAFLDLIGDEAILRGDGKALWLENATLYPLRECRDWLWRGVRSLFDLTGHPLQRPWGMRPMLWKGRRY